MLRANMPRWVCFSYESWCWVIKNWKHGALQFCTALLVLFLWWFSFLFSGISLWRFYLNNGISWLEIHFFYLVFNTSIPLSYLRKDSIKIQPVSAVFLISTIKLWFLRDFFSVWYLNRPIWLTLFGFHHYTIFYSLRVNRMLFDRFPCLLLISHYFSFKNYFPSFVCVLIPDVFFPEWLYVQKETNEFWPMDHPCHI